MRFGNLVSDQKYLVSDQIFLVTDQKKFRLVQPDVVDDMRHCCDPMSGVYDAQLCHNRNGSFDEHIKKRRRKAFKWLCSRGLRRGRVHEQEYMCSVCHTYACP